MVFKIATTGSEMIRVKVFIVSFHFYARSEITDLEKGCEWYTIWIGPFHGSGSNRDSGSYPKKITFRRFRIDVCVLNIYRIASSSLYDEARECLFVWSSYH